MRNWVNGQPCLLDSLRMRPLSWSLVPPITLGIAGSSYLAVSKSRVLRISSVAGGGVFVWRHMVDWLMGLP